MRHRIKLALAILLLVALPALGQDTFGGGRGGGGGAITGAYSFNGQQFSVANTTNIALKSGALGTNLSLFGTLTINAATASQPLLTDGSKNAVSGQIDLTSGSHVVVPHGNQAYTTNSFANERWESTVLGISNACRLVSNTVHIVAGDYYFGGNSLFLTNGTKIKAIGRGTVRLIFNSAATLYCVQPNDNNYLSGLTILCTNATGALNIPFGTPGSTSATNVLVEHCELNGITDTFYCRDNQSFKFQDCLLTSLWDGENIIGGVAELHECSVIVRNGGSAVSPVIIGLRQSGGTNRVFNSAVDVQDGVAETLGARCIGGRMEIYGGSVSASSSKGIALSLSNRVGTIVAKGPQINNAIGGTVDSSAVLLSIEGSLGREIRGYTEASGRYTNALTDRFIFFDVSSAAGTNTLPDIGFQTTVSIVVSNQPANGNTFVLNGVTFTWKTSAGASPDIQIGADQSESTLNLADAIFFAPNDFKDSAWGVAFPTETNLVYTSRPDQTFTYSQTGTWGVLTSTTNDYPTAAGRLITVKDSKGSAATRNITVKPQRLATIDGASSYVLNQNYRSVTFMAVGTNWTVTSEGIAGTSGSGDVTAASGFGTDNLLIRADGTAKGVQSSAASLSDAGLLAIPSINSTNFTNFGPLVVSSASPPITPGAARILGTNNGSGTGFYELTVPVVGQSNSIVMWPISVSAGQILGFVQGVTVQAGTNSIVSTNASFASGWGAQLAVSTASATITSYATNALALMATNATTYQADFTGGTPLIQTADLMRTNVTLQLTNPIVGRQMTFHFRGDGNAVDRTVIVSTNGMTGNWPISWGWNSPTNGATAFTVTNNMGAELSLLVLSNRISALWQPMR